MAESSLPKAAERLAAIVESSDDAIVSKTLEGVITSWNAAAERLFGYSAAEAVGQPILMIIPRERHTEEAHVLEQIRSGQKVEHFETIRVAKNGREIPISLTVSPIRDAQGKIVGASKIARDVSLQKELERQRVLALEAAEAANRAKDDFLAMFGHELRNPLAAVVAATELLDRIGTLSQLERPRAILKRQARHLQRLIDDLLDAARVRAGKIGLERTPLDLADAVERALSALQVEPARRAAVQKHLEPAVGVLADPVRLEQMILNLLGNALKYTPADRAIRVSVAAQGEWAVLSVEDDGVGIAADVLPHIFELFVQSERSLDRAGGGLGIGLSLVKTLAELHGGRAEAHSDGPGKGSRFTLRLPRVELAGEEAETVVPTAGQSVRILLIEDNADAREMLVTILRLHGHQVHEAADGEKALELAARTHPDIMLVDIGLPLLDGYEVARRIRRLPRQPRRLIALTGYGMPEDRSACLRAGFDDHIVKPIDIDRLLSLIQPS